MNKYSVYVLIKEGSPIYVGCTMDIKRRVSQHRVVKSFDTYKIVKSYDNKQDADNAENAILRYEALFGLSDLKNKKDQSLSHTSNYIITQDKWKK